MRFPGGGGRRRHRAGAALGDQFLCNRVGWEWCRASVGKIRRHGAAPPDRHQLGASPPAGARLAVHSRTSERRRAMRVWCNGAMREGAAIEPGDRGFTLGDGLFETLRWADGAARHLDRHLARLRAGAAFLGIPLRWSDAELGAAMAAVVREPGLEEAAIRLSLSRGPSARGLLPPSEPRPTVVVSAGPLPPAGSATAIVARSTRRNEYSPLSRIKSLCYLDNVIAAREAAECGADQALLLNTAGRLAESAAANLFLVSAGELLTPPVSDGALPGIARQLLIERCGAIERPLDVEALISADHAFLSNSLGLRALNRIDGRTLAVDEPLLSALATRIDR
ncbi:aminotransferase class IV [Lysobacter firmicutimachus]|uniref:Aminotransferase class IV n=1 Tax=Lysobacter firmicutimachus TaxID=1792846 RepID=A0ABU8D5B0_9GAMM